MKTYLYLKLTTAVLLILSQTGCKKLVETEPPATQLTANKVFENDATATAALSNIYYTSINGNFADGGLNSVTLLAGLSSDELENFSESSDLVQISSNQIIASNGPISNLWNSCYRMIYESNALLEGLENSGSVSPGVKQQLSGEALFLRSFAHLYLSSLFGNVPVVTSTDYRKNTSISQSDKQQVLQSVISDLLLAIPKLTTSYTAWNNERVRANQWAAKALLARAYLYAEDWTNAESTAIAVIEHTSLFELAAPAEVFLKNSKEAIWQLKPEGITYNTKEGNQFILINRPNLCALNPKLKNIFETGDQRAANWIGTYSSGPESWLFPYKYKISQGGTPLNEYSMVLRLAEQYLIRAEARAMQNKYGPAIQDINLIRLKHGALTIPLADPLDRQGCLEIILHERQVELFSEWGHRWIDLARFDQSTQALSALKPGWTGTAILYPIPQNELTVNTSLVQNPGYH